MDLWTLWHIPSRSIVIFPYYLIVPGFLVADKRNRLRQMCFFSIQLFSSHTIHRHYIMNTK